MEDNVLTRTSLPLSVAQSLLPFRMTQSQCLTALSQSLPVFPICSPLYSQIGVLACLCCGMRCCCFSCFCVHFFCCPAWVRMIKGDFFALSGQACCLMVPGTATVCRAPPVRE